MGERVSELSVEEKLAVLVRYPTSPRRKAKMRTRPRLRVAGRRF